MSAIFGIVGEASDADLEAMGARLAHKGPHIETWSPDRNVHLGEARHWPRGEAEDPCTAASVCLNVDWSTFDKAQTATAEGRDRIRRDHLYDVLGKGAVNVVAGLDGMWSFAHWDQSAKRLFLAVDRTGYERLYFAKTRQGLAFASDYKALLALPDVEISVNPDAMQYAIAVAKIDWFKTFAEGIDRVPQAHVGVYDGNAISIESYWEAFVRPRSISLSSAASELRELLLDHVRRVIIPYGKIGLTLSGGLDSSCLLGAIREVGEDKPVSTYTIGYSEDDPEIVGARETAAHYATDHNELIFDPRTIPRDLPQLVWLAEDFAGRGERVLQYQVERHLMKSEEVVFAGHGADMSFGGMPRHRLLRMAETIPFARRPLLEVYQQTQSGRVPSSLRGRLASWMIYRGRNVVPPRITGAGDMPRVKVPGSFDEFIEQTIYEMPEYHAHSATQALAPFEAESPFLSNRMVEFALTLPAHLKSSVFRQKIVLREACKPFLPGETSKRGKAIQRVSQDRLLAEILDGMADELLGKAGLAGRGLVADEYISRIRHRGKSGVYAGDQFSRLWMLLVCELWCRTFIDNRGRAPVELR